MKNDKIIAVSFIFIWFYFSRGELDCRVLHYRKIGFRDFRNTLDAYLKNPELANIPKHDRLSYHFAFKKIGWITWYTHFT